MTTLRMFLRDRSPVWIIGLGIAITLVIGVVERVVPAGDTLWVLYLIPIGIVTWYASWRAAVVIAMLSLLPVLFFSERLQGGAANPIGAAELTVRFALIVGLIYLLNQSKEAPVASAEALRTDPSTGLANSRALFDLIANELERANRYSRPFSIAYVGIENLPAIRLRSGNDAAEEVLRTMANEIRRSIRSVDHVARLRDREFALLLPETGAESAGIVLDRMQRVLEGSLKGDGPTVSFTIGAITWLRSNLTAEELHQRTYQLMYAARQEGAQIRHVVLDDAMHPRPEQVGGQITVV